MSSYIKDPKTLEDFVANARFQLDNVEGYLQMQRDRADDLIAVHTKAKCLVDAAASLVAATEAEMRLQPSRETEKESA